MVEEKAHRGSTSCFIGIMFVLLHTVQMTIKRIALAQARDEVGDGPIASVWCGGREDDLFGCGCMLGCGASRASRGLSAATPSIISPESAGTKLTLRRLRCHTRCLLSLPAPHVPSLRLHRRRSHVAMPHHHLIPGTAPALWPPEQSQLLFRKVLKPSCTREACK